MHGFFSVDFFKSSEGDFKISCVKQKIFCFSYIFWWGKRYGYLYNISFQMFIIIGSINISLFFSDNFVFLKKELLFWSITKVWTTAITIMNNWPITLLEINDVGQSQGELRNIFMFEWWKRCITINTKHVSSSKLVLLNQFYLSVYFVSCPKPERREKEGVFSWYIKIKNKRKKSCVFLEG